MADEETPQIPSPAPTLLERLETEFKRLRSRDRTIARFEGEIRRHTNTIRIAHQLRKLSQKSIKQHEGWIREEAAVRVREAAGVKSIPGFASRRDDAIAFRKRLKERVRESEATAKLHLLAPAPPAPPSA